jgi:hypothetical protein
VLNAHPRKLDRIPVYHWRGVGLGLEHDRDDNLHSMLVLPQQERFQQSLPLAVEGPR